MSDPSEPEVARRSNSSARSGSADGHTVQSLSWPEALAERLFAIPARWGWRSVERVEPARPPELQPYRRPEWTEPPRPDIGDLLRARSVAFGNLFGRLLLVFGAAIGFALTADGVRRFFAEGGWDPGAYDTYVAAVGIGIAVLALRVLPKLGALYVAFRNIREFERPFRQARSAARRRYEQAVAEWDDAVSEYEAAARHAATRRAEAPLWYPVHPAARPIRVDVLGGDPRRHGWASLLVTLGASVLAGGERIAVLDLTGRDVGGGLLRVANARGLVTQRIDLPADAANVYLLGSVRGQNLAACLGYALTGRQEGGDLRHERALAKDVIQLVVNCLDGDVSFARLAAGVQILRRATPGSVLSPAERNRLAEHVGEIGQDEWSVRQVRFIASQLDLLAAVATGGALGRPLWGGGHLSLIATAGGRDDRKELIDRLLVQLAQDAMHNRRRFADFLVVAGADHLGAATLEILSDHARTTGVRLLLMIDQPQGDIERTVGTGGAVCVMKLYNHKDAAAAADFIGRDYRFVVSQVTREVGRSFSDGGGDSLAAATDRGSVAPPGSLRERGPTSGLSESRGHTWSGVRNWSSTQNIGTSSTSTRMYEFTVDPGEILGMPETAFILVDNSGSGRTVVMADCNPGISLLGRVALTAD